jgi:protein transport protein SEC24
MAPSDHLTTLGTLSCMTGGDTFLYSNFIASRDALRLAGDFRRTITRETGYQAMMKVRCSNGLHAADYDGNFFQRKPTEIEFGTIDADKAVVVKFKHEEKLEGKFDVAFQSALLYTTATGERRVRVQNIAVRTTNDIDEVFKTADEDAIIVTIAKEASFKMLTKTSREVREGIGDKCIRILATYRKYHGSGAHQGQLILPDKLRLLPLYTLSLLKTIAFRGLSGILINIDGRR